MVIWLHYVGLRALYTLVYSAVDGVLFYITVTSSLILYATILLAVLLTFTCFRSSLTITVQC